MQKERIYVCHTFYHVYVSILKEFALSPENPRGATMVLSKMSTDFSGLKERLVNSNIFETVIEYDEKRYTYFPELLKYKENKGNFVKKIINRIIFTKKFAKLQEEYIPLDFSQYKNIYVYCDSDPIGYYLNYKKIKYHALEDGLNSLVHVDAARYDNRGNFGLKSFLAKCNLIFIQNGYSKYCVDMEVNQIDGILFPIAKHIEVPRKALQDRLTDKEKDKILEVFIENRSEITNITSCMSERTEKILILTEPLCDLKTRKRIFEDLIKQYGKKGKVILKPHPRDELDYKKEFPNNTVIEKMVPMEVFNFITEESFDTVVSVLTDLNGVSFAKEKIRLGPDFMDKYESPEIHRQNEQI